MINKKIDLIFRPFDARIFLDRLMTMAPEKILETIALSGLRGRGGAGFPTGKKWASAAAAEGPEIIVCNADEGEPGTFKDREILETQAEKLFCGMAACARAVGADEGFLYLRGEYAYLLDDLNRDLGRFGALTDAVGLLFRIEIRLGSGAYICGEETALLESLEGRRGEARNKPPFPTVRGYRGRPTVINNVETFIYGAVILDQGAEAFSSLGTRDSRGAKILCVSGDTPCPGIYELEMGMNLGDFVKEFGDGDTKAVQIGGSGGLCVPRKLFDSTIIGFEGIPTGGSMLLFHSGRSMYNVLKSFLEFFSTESCGQCTPCRVGCQQLLLGIEAVKTGVHPPAYLDRLRSLAQTMAVSSKCGLGQSVPRPFLSITDHFREEILY